MRLFPRSLALLAVLGLASATTQLSPATAQTNDDIATLEAEVVGLEDQIATLRDTVATIDEDIDALDVELRRLPIELELVADAYTRAQADRAAPEQVRAQVAIDAYIRNDNQLSTFLAETEQLSEDPLEGVRARELYNSAIDQAIAQLDAIDDRMRDLSDDVDEVREQTRDAEEARADKVAERELAVAEIATLETEIEELEAQIDYLKSLQTRVLLTNLPGATPNRSALVIKIDNVEPARPQSGINQADVVWEELVEGGFTRLAALFQSTGATVGPIRSMRTTDMLLLANLNDPLFGHSGGNPVTRQALQNSNLIDVGVTSAGSEYYRVSDRRNPHTLFSSTDRLWALDGATRLPPPLFAWLDVFETPPDSAPTASQVSLDFGSTDVSYTWNGATWDRTMNGTAHVDTSGVQVSPANVIVQITTYGTSPADARSPEAVVTGTGEVLVFTGGRVIQGEWSRPDLLSPTTYTANGAPIELQAGRTWIALAPSGSVSYG